MAYGVYFRRKDGKAYERVIEFFKPTSNLTSYAITASGVLIGVRDLVCATLQEAKEVEKRYIDRGYDTKIKEVK